MDKLWSHLVKGLQEGTLTDTDKVEDLLGVARVKLDIAAAKNKLHHTQAKLGARVHQLLRANADPIDDDQVQILSSKLETLFTELAASEASYDALHNESQTDAINDTVSDSDKRAV